MRSSSIVQLCLFFLLLLAASSKGFFFEYPKKAVLDFFQSFKEKKDPKKKPIVNNIRHYHVHYYPQQIHVLKASDSYELHSNNRDNPHSLEWSEDGYKSVPEPGFSISSLYESWNQVHPWSRSKGSLEPDVSKTNSHTEDQGILIRIPIHQQIVVQQPHSTQHLSSSLLATFFQKIGRTQATDSHVTT